MRNKELSIYCIPQYVFLFLSFYVINKFIVIFFFKAAFFPRFLFHLTPLNWFVGFDDTQLLALSLIVMLGNMILHVSMRRRHVQYSLMVTMILLIGIGLAIATAPFSIEYFLHYAIFFILMICLLLDYRLLLILSGSIRNNAFSRLSSMSSADSNKTIPTITHPRRSKRPVTARPGRPVNISKPHTLFSSLSSGLSKLFHPPSLPPSRRFMNFSRSSNMLESRSDIDQCNPDPNMMIPIEENTRSHIVQLDHMIDEIRIDPAELTDEYYDNIKDDLLRSNFSPPVMDTCISEDDKRRAYQHLVDSIDEQAIIINRGVIKAVNSSIAHKLGYDPAELIERNFLHLLSMDSIPVYRRNVVSRLHGGQETFQSLVLVSKYHKKQVVHVSSRTIKIIEGTADLLIIQNVAT